MQDYNDRQNEYFSSRFKKYGYSHRSLSWESPHTQNARFVEMLRICTLGNTFNNISILDYGCGLGHLYKFMKDNGWLEKWGADYTGVDINKDFIEEAKKRHPEVRFELNDGSVFNEKYDYVMCSGIYNLKYSEEYDIRSHYREELSKLFQIAAQGVAVNFQSTNAVSLIPERMRAQELKRFYFHDMQTVISDMMCITDKIKTSTRYLDGDYDFTVYLLK